MSGKKRRRPLKGKHKFFEKTGSQSSSQDTSDENRRQNNSSHSEVQNCRLLSEVQSGGSCSHSEVQSRGSCLHPEVHCPNNRLHSVVTNKGNARSHPEMQNENGNSHPQVQNTQQNGTGRWNKRKSNEYMENGKKNDTQVHNVMSASETHTNQENEQEFVNSRPRMVGVKLIRERSFYLIQYGHN